MLRKKYKIIFMTKDQTELKKLRILLNAINATEDEEAPDFVQELKNAAWNVLKENPGIDCPEWIDILIRQYPTEVVDAFGSNPPEVHHQLTDLWEMEYTDNRTGDWHSFAEWAEYFATDRSVELYELYSDVKEELNRTKTVPKTN